jgi:hypothetical protein
VALGRILTTDNLRKRGIIIPVFNRAVQDWEMDYVAQLLNPLAKFRLLSEELL